MLGVTIDDAIKMLREERGLLELKYAAYTLAIDALMSEKAKGNSCYNCKYTHKNEFEMSCLNCLHNKMDYWKSEEDGTTTESEEK